MASSTMVKSLSSGGTRPRHGGGGGGGGPDTEGQARVQSAFAARGQSRLPCPNRRWKRDLLESAVPVKLNVLEVAKIERVLSGAYCKLANEWRRRLLNPGQTAIQIETLWKNMREKVLQLRVEYKTPWQCGLQ
ncbi:hypothetical protein B0H13DRAFT_1873384 [Mycena leptocephala]|nr:hypothetical protein B0H13DRAFT_1873384 [Mycena leptocephala]